MHLIQRGKNDQTFKECIILKKKSEGMISSKQRKEREISKILQPKNNFCNKTFSLSTEVRKRVSSQRSKILERTKENNSSQSKRNEIYEQNQQLRTINLLKGNTIKKNQTKSLRKQKITQKNVQKYFNAFVKNYESKDKRIKEMIHQEYNFLYQNGLNPQKESMKFIKKQQLKDTVNFEQQRLTLLKEWKINCDQEIKQFAKYAKPDRNYSLLTRKSTVQRKKKDPQRVEVQEFKLEGWQSVDDEYIQTWLNQMK